MNAHPILWWVSIEKRKPHHSHRHLEMTDWLPLRGPSKRGTYGINERSRKCVSRESEKTEAQRLNQKSAILEQAHKFS